MYLSTHVCIIFVYVLVCTNVLDHKFDLALQLGVLKIAFQLTKLLN